MSTPPFDTRYFPDSSPTQHLSEGRGSHASSHRGSAAIIQRWEDYTHEEHGLWCALYVRQQSLLAGRACLAFQHGLARLDAGAGVPNFALASMKLRAATGWTLEPAPGLLPEHEFFCALSERRFPVTVWLRSCAEMDYIAEPDIFHDFFGHVPMLFDPVFARHMHEYGKMALRAHAQGASAYAGRLYWRTVEFGVVREDSGMRAYGAGILSSKEELLRAAGPEAVYEPFGVESSMSKPYVIDSLQPSYALIDSLADLFGIDPAMAEHSWVRQMALDHPGLLAA